MAFSSFNYERPPYCDWYGSESTHPLNSGFIDQHYYVEFMPADEPPRDFCGPPTIGTYSFNHPMSDTQIDRFKMGLPRAVPDVDSVLYQRQADHTNHPILGQYQLGDIHTAIIDGTGISSTNAASGYLFQDQLAHSPGHHSPLANHASNVGNTITSQRTWSNVDSGGGQTRERIQFSQ